MKTNVLFRVLGSMGGIVGLFLALVAVSSCGQSLQVHEQAVGSDDHVIMVEAPGHFRIATLRGMNYGLSQWFDLVNDPAASRNILHRPDDDKGDQASFFNQVINPGDMIGHIAQAGTIFKTIPRSCRIVEQNAVRVILDTQYHTMLNNVNNVNTGLFFRTVYTIYGTGRIGIRHSLHADKGQGVDLWRNSTLSVGDPTYHFNPVDKGNGKLEGHRLVDPSRQWAANCYAGMQVNVQGWRSYAIEGNTADTIQLGAQLSGQPSPPDVTYEIVSQAGRYGWLRCSDLQSPYSWQGSRSAYLRMYWDPQTPPPYTDWTKGSLMLVPKPDNPHQGGQSVHGWDRFKRFYYEEGHFDLAAGETVTQDYMIQLGTKGDTLLPDLSRDDAAKACADAYRIPQEVDVVTGSQGIPPFDFGRACYRFGAHDGKLTLAPKQTLLNPVIEVTGIDGSIDVKSDKGQLDFVSARTESNTIVLQVWGTLDPGKMIEIVAKK